ncbi:uncharacterized protein DNG_02442 [Cephalotrichum gorgonifer]|uniref:Uncharacterized protein n=1 Tax=Cephalotrichum gorgonifer TaxID=2041049 RepID=A0AAE8ST27_9PEZI|nr:uncharacterized protein DNG_02442 [Cephalotrichum gorgonifer]
MTVIVNPPVDHPKDSCIVSKVSGEAPLVQTVWDQNDASNLLLDGTCAMPRQPNPGPNHGGSGSGGWGYADSDRPSSATNYLETKVSQGAAS